MKFRTTPKHVAAVSTSLVTALALGAAALAPAAASAAEENESPIVVPALQAWEGGQGHLTLTPDSRIVTDDESASVAEQLAADFSSLIGFTPRVVTSGAEPGDIVLDLDPALTHADGADRFTEEGYVLSISDIVSIDAPSETGVFYGTRSLLQAMLGSDGRTTLPVGEAVDWPDYEVRGFMLDTGRRFFDADFVRDYIAMMSWYKLNNFQIHLNDNRIDRPSTGWKDAYSGFRLQSENPEYAGLASEDGAYTRADWESFEDVAAAHSVMIIPEIDVPAHSLPFIKWKPELGLYNGDSDHLDLTKPETTEIIKGVFDEFAPWFEGPVLHFGADEYPREYVDEYKQFFNDMAAHVRSLGKEPRAWGSMSVMSGNADGYDKDVVINAWNDGWYGMRAALADGYEFINTNDSTLYVVPFANYYHGNGLNNSMLYNSWLPNRLSTEDIVPAGAPLGAMFAVWNDLVDADYTQLDVHGLMRDSFPVIAQKTWNAQTPELSYADFSTAVKDIGRGASLSVIEQSGSADLGEISFGAAVSVTSGTDAEALTDGRALTRWATTEESADVTIDLGEVLTAGFVETDWAGNAPEAYDVEVSRDGIFWQVIAEDVPGSAEAVEVGGVGARYVALRNIRTGGEEISAWGTRVYAPRALTEGAIAVASGDEAPSTPASAAADGNTATRWSASSVANPWITLDLGTPETFSQVDILWEAAAASAYEVQVSEDATTWTTVATKTGMPAPTGSSRADVVTFEEQTAQHLRVVVNGKTMSPYLSIYEISIPDQNGADAQIVGSTTAIPGEDGVYAGEVPVLVAAEGADGAVSGLAARVDGGEWAAIDGEYLVGGEGDRVVEYRAKVGDTAVRGYAKLAVDAVGPPAQIKLTPEGGLGSVWRPVSAVLGSEADDLATLKYRINAGEWVDIAQGAAVEFAEVGEFEIEVRATDVRGNEGEIASESIVIAPVNVNILGGGGQTTQLIVGEPFMVSVSEVPVGTVVDVELHSDPIALGSFTVAENGAGSLEVTIPASFDAVGEHELVVILRDGETVAQTVRVPVTVALAEPVPADADANADAGGDAGTGGGATANAEAGSDGGAGAAGGSDAGADAGAGASGGANAGAGASGGADAAAGGGAAGGASGSSDAAGGSSDGAVPSDSDGAGSGQAPAEPADDLDAGDADADLATTGGETATLVNYALFGLFVILAGAILARRAHRGTD